jgi:hypothetical protein
MSTNFKSSNSYAQDAYIDPADLHYLGNSDCWLDIDNCYLETTQQSESAHSPACHSHHSNSSVLSTHSLVRCEQYATQRHSRAIRNSPVVCEPRRSPKQSAHYYSYEQEHESLPSDYGAQETMDLPDSCLLFATYNSTDETRYASGEQLIHNAISKSTPNENPVGKKASRLNRPTVNCCTNVKKIVSKFTKKLRATKTASIQLKSSELQATKKSTAVQLAVKAKPMVNNQQRFQHQQQHSQYPKSSVAAVSIEKPRRKTDRVLYLLKNQPSQFSSNNYELENIFENNNNQFKTLGDIVTYYI